MCLSLIHISVYGYGSLGNNESGFGEVGGNMDYQHSFKKKGELLTFSYRFSHSPNNLSLIHIYVATMNDKWLNLSFKTGNCSILITFVLYHNLLKLG